MEPMNEIKATADFGELLALTKSFLLQEFKNGQHVFSDPATYEYFKKWRPKTAKQTFATPPKPVQAQRLPPPPLPSNPPPLPSLPPPPAIELEVAQKVIPAVPPLAREEKPLETKGARFSLTLEPVNEVQEIELFSIRKDFAKLFPERQLLETPPDDALAKKMGQLWKAQQSTPPEVVILSFQEGPEQQFFLQKIKGAVNERLAPCVIFSALTIEKRQVWDKILLMEGLRLIVAFDGIHSLPGLMSFYRESAEKTERYLGDIPFLQLSDLSLYLQQPQLKAALWQALCALLPSKQ